MAHGKSIRIFLGDGEATGIRYLELVGWTGQALVVPRSRILELKGWPESARAGVYLLLGLTESGDPVAYIGESENVRDRIGNHLKSEDHDFSEVILFTSKDENLTKGHVKFLEGLMYDEAKNANRFALWNGAKPAATKLPRPDSEAMQEFLDNLKILVQTVGCSLFTPLVQAVPQAEPLPELTMTCPDLDIHAKGRQTDEGFLVFKDSEAAKADAPALGPTYQNLRRNLHAQGVLVNAGNKFTFAADYLFGSSSAAASVVAGSQRSGPQNWKNAQNETLKDIEAKQIPEIESIEQAPDEPAPAAAIPNA